MADKKSQEDLSKNIFVKIQRQIFSDFGGGPKILPLRYLINFQKGATLFYCMTLMKYFNNYSLGCYLYAAVHGSYGLMWLLKVFSTLFYYHKDFTFPDKSWAHKVTFGTLLIGQTGLLGYWALPFMLAKGYGIQEPSNLRIFAVIMTYVIGVVTMMASDAQKYYTLKYKSGLIDSGMFKYCRNPNYLGEILVYLSFAMTVGKTEAYCIPAFIWITIFTLNMHCKDLSLQKKEGWKEYQKRSFILLPKINGSTFASVLFYGTAFLAGWDLYQGTGYMDRGLNFLMSFIKK